ncbi:MAG: glutamate--tRNA ligase [Actinobacteria bacterium]|nr:glutamate--tRNA ligase [Actinomycetota bacterium]
MPALPVAPDAPVRVRFCPSPTGNPHVGMVRTCLFNWAYARHTGGTFIFRIEDTDAARDSEESYEQLLEALRWLGFDWDEGPEVGGPHAPYRQSERMQIYADVAAKLEEAGFAYRCFCTPEELEERREAARAAGKTPGYDGHCRNLGDAERAAYAAEGRQAALRFGMPGHDFVWNDVVRGELRFEAEHVPDYVLVRANGEPLYTLVNPVDDALMGVTHVLRGEDLLSSTPRQIALHNALADIGVGHGLMPNFGHLPYVMGEGNRKLSKRDPESSLRMYRDSGYLPEGLANYLALLGWSFGEDREFFSKTEMAAVFDVARVNPNPARFDLAKCTAVNADWIRHLSATDLAERLIPYLQSEGVLAETVTPEQHALLLQAVPLVQERMEVLTQGVAMLSFLFVGDRFTLDADDAAAVLTADSQPVLARAHDALDALASWNTTDIEAALRETLISGLGLKPKVAFTAVRVAVTGRRVSPPLFESLELLGRDMSLARLDAARKMH